MLENKVKEMEKRLELLIEEGNYKATKTTAKEIDENIMLILKEQKEREKHL